MSWDAHIATKDVDGNELIVAVDTNYTHNCNCMANHALGRTALSWWEILNEMSVKDSIGFLKKIISALEADPTTYQAMNPPNGWGSYDRFLNVLKQLLSEARYAAEKYPSSYWKVYG